MTVSAITTEDGNKIELNISGRFDFNDHGEFRNSYRHASSGAEYIVNMRGAEYLDSSALGMLLLLREHAGGDKANIRIINTPSEIMRIFNISNFQNLFQIS